MHKIVNIVEKFALQKSLSDKPVLLALSGGTDSLALFYALLHCKAKIGLDFHIAHVNHGWRTESEDEAKTLASIAAENSIIFHQKKLDPKQLSGNLEMACRNARYSFFAELCETFLLQGVFVGHHLNDQAETILKRIFEGSDWTKTAGLKEVVQRNNLTIYRPFLEVAKVELEDFLIQINSVPFYDSTNEDTKFLRANMRKEIIPWLNNHFKKNIETALVKHGQDLNEIDLFFKNKLACFLESIISGQLGNYLLLEQKLPESLLEIKFIIKKIIESVKAEFSRSQIQKAAEALIEGKANVTFNKGNCSLLIDRKRIFIVNEAIKNQKWALNITPFINEVASSNWETIWDGKGIIILPEGNYRLAYFHAEEFVNKKEIDKFWTSNKVPAFLRNQIPVLVEENKIVHEFLTGKRLMSIDGSNKTVIIEIFLE